jgi:hypothetical protein
MEEVLERLVRLVDEKRYGKYRGFVKERNDPEKRGRLKLVVPSVLNDAVTDWALPCFAAGGKANQGVFIVPENGSQVWVEFEEGNVALPIWTGCFFQQESDVPEAARLEEPTTYLLQTPAGHVLRLDEAKGAETIVLHHASGAEIHLDPDGGISLQDKNGARLFLDGKNDELSLQDSHGNALEFDSSGATLRDANQNSLQLSTSGVTLKAQSIVLDATKVALGGAGGEPVALGQALLMYLSTHTHTSIPAGGPTSPPVPPPMPTTLSMKVTTS